MSETNPYDQTDATGEADQPAVADQVDAADQPAVADQPAAADQVDADAPVADGLGDHATGDIVIDSALQDLRSASAEDLDAQIEAGRRVHQTLHARLSDLGGE